MLFHIVEGAQVIVSRRGVYKQVALYQRDGELYAGLNKTSFVRLLGNRGTSQPDTLWEEIIGVSVVFGWLDRPKLPAPEKMKAAA